MNSIITLKSQVVGPVPELSDQIKALHVERNNEQNESTFIIEEKKLNLILILMIIITSAFSDQSNAYI